MAHSPTLATCDCCNRAETPVSEFRIGTEFFELCLECQHTLIPLTPPQLSFISEHFLPRSIVGQR